MWLVPIKSSLYADHATQCMQIDSKWIVKSKCHGQDHKVTQVFAKAGQYTDDMSTSDLVRISFYGTLIVFQSKVIDQWSPLDI